MTSERIGIIFDCDGTLLDSSGVWHEMEDEFSRRAGVRLTKADTDELNTLTVPESGAFFHERFGLGASAADVVGMIDEFVLGYYRERACERPGALAFVRALAERGVAMSVASSSPQAYLQAGLETAGFLPYLDAVVSVDDVGKPKREPAVYDRARELMGTPLCSTWGFEDSSYAVRTLRAAGYRTMGVYDSDLAGTYEDLAALCDHVVRGFGELDAGEFITWSVAPQASSSCPA
ncbi:MAG TPA: HAD family phosphatase [Rubneribacter badeniensis]|uniref:HAD family phosphatase n=1 Tax=Rubneribacter badeniensis TaxID=2070688 RepID=A0A9D2VJW8_9ACTN|nr:HAD family phosphatase [Rubneribacter badeniensis]